jgi:hypothetical protein
MDDIWLFGSDEGRLRRAQIELQQAARSLGLELNSGKTDVLLGDAMVSEAMQIEHSAVDSALRMNDTEPLEDLIDRLLENPVAAGRTSLNFAMNRMRVSKSSYRIDDLLDNAPRMPHAADFLALLLSQRLHPSQLEEWVMSYAASEWCSFQWALAQYVSAFPSGQRGKIEVVEFLTDRVTDPGTSLPLLANCAHKLAMWDPVRARAAIRHALTLTAQAQSRRVLALAALTANESRQAVRECLSEVYENEITLDMLKDRSFRPPKTVDMPIR